MMCDGGQPLWHYNPYFTLCISSATLQFSSTTTNFICGKPNATAWKVGKAGGGVVNDVLVTY